jgi:hypothetical protein
VAVHEAAAAKMRSVHIDVRPTAPPIGELSALLESSHLKRPGDPIDTGGETGFSEPKRRRRVKVKAPFVPQLAVVVMAAWEVERRDRVARSLARLRKDPKFTNMPVRQIMAKYRHLLDIMEMPTILINPDAEIKISVSESALANAKQTLQDLVDQDAAFK